jgi:hypothetical protein
VVSFTSQSGVHINSDICYQKEITPPNAAAQDDFNFLLQKDLNPLTPGPSLQGNNFPARDFITASGYNQQAGGTVEPW